MMSRKLKIGIGLLVLLLLMQLIRREKNISTEPLEATSFVNLEQPPAAIAKILEDA